MISEKLVRELIDERIEGTDIFLVSVSITPGNKITVVVDADSGLAIDDCINVSRGIEHNLDREEQDFELSVLSPGLDNPLQVTRQYHKNVGRGLKVKLIEGGKLEGTLTEAHEDHIVLVERVKERVEGKKKKEWVEKKYTIQYNNINEAKVAISFK